MVYCLEMLNKLFAICFDTIKVMFCFVFSLCNTFVIWKLVLLFALTIMSVISYFTCICHMILCLVTLYFCTNLHCTSVLFEIYVFDIINRRKWRKSFRYWLKFMQVFANCLPFRRSSKVRKELSTKSFHVHTSISIS